VFGVGLLAVAVLWASLVLFAVSTPAGLSLGTALGLVVWALLLLAVTFIFLVILVCSRTARGSWLWWLASIAPIVLIVGVVWATSQNVPLRARAYINREDLTRFAEAQLPLESRREYSGRVGTFAVHELYMDGDCLLLVTNPDAGGIFAMTTLRAGLLFCPASTSPRGVSEPSRTPHDYRHLFGEWWEFHEG
jgi:hypothetical protein